MEEPNQPENVPPRKNLFSINKINYARGERPNVDCILCGVTNKDEKVDNSVRLLARSGIGELSMITE